MFVYHSLNEKLNARSSSQKLAFKFSIKVTGNGGKERQFSSTIYGSCVYLKYDKLYSIRIVVKINMFTVEVVMLRYLAGKSLI